MKRITPTNSKNVTQLKPPINKDAARPIKIWIANERRHAPRLSYVNEYKAHMRALIEADQAKVGTSLEVYDVRHGWHLATYKTVVGGVQSWHSKMMKYLIGLERKSA